MEPLLVDFGAIFLQNTRRRAVWRSTVRNTVLIVVGSHNVVNAIVHFVLEVLKELDIEVSVLMLCFLVPD